jgi:hypothetical protein
MSRRPLLIVALVAVAGFAAGLFLLRRPSAPPKPLPRATGTPAAIAIAPTPQASRTPGQVVRTETQFEPVDDDQITAKQAAAAAARYRKAARYPRTSRPLDDGLDPIATSRSPKVDFEGDDKHREPRLLTYPSITRFEAPNEVTIYAEIVELREVEKDPRKPDRPRLQSFRVDGRNVRGVIETPDGRQVATLQFRDDGSRGDAQANDKFFTATYTPDPDKPDAFRGKFQVIVRGETPKGDEVTASTEFVYSVQTARLTGQYRDSLVDGNLRIDAEVEAEDPGRYRVEGTLVTTADAKMIGYAYSDVDLVAGRSWVPLTYYGLIFHDMKADGPYSLFSLVLSTLAADGTPEEGEVVPSPYTTGKYEVGQFGTAPFNDPEYVRKAEHYDAIAHARADQNKAAQQ